MEIYHIDACDDNWPGEVSVLDVVVTFGLIHQMHTVLTVDDNKDQYTVTAMCMLS